MGKSVEKSAKTVDEAVKLALKELEVQREDVEVEGIEEGNKGILGIIRNRDAKVIVTVKETMAEKAKKFLLSIFEKMDVVADIETSEDNKSILLAIKGDDVGVIIGRRGETLDSLQYLTSLVVNRGSSEYKRITIDMENYRQKRKETLIKLANRLADKVKKYRKSITLEPMNPYERRIIHSTLQDDTHVKTYSVGDEPNRKVVITTRGR